MKTYAVVSLNQNVAPEVVHTYGPGTANIYSGGFGGRGVFGDIFEAALCLDAFESANPDATYVIMPGEFFGEPIIESYVAGFEVFEPVFEDDIDDSDIIFDGVGCEQCDCGCNDADWDDEEDIWNEKIDLYYEETIF